MINLDLSKVLHPRFWDLLPAVMPGLFFEICVFLAQPEWLKQAMGQAQLERYIEIAITLILAFILGNGFMFLVVMLRIESRRVYKWSRLLWVTFIKYVTSSKSNSPLQRPWLGQFKWVDRARRNHLACLNAKGAFQAWQIAASTLLERRYGIDPLRIKSDEWSMWISVLGTPRRNDVKGALLIVASHATGWSGLAAAYVAPSLQNRYFLPFCGFLIIFGLLHDLSLTARLENQRARWVIALTGVLDEIPAPPDDKDHVRQTKPSSI